MVIISVYVSILYKTEMYMFTSGQKMRSSYLICL